MSSQVRQEQPTVPHPQPSPLVDHRQRAGQAPTALAVNARSSSGQELSSLTVATQRAADSSAAPPPEKRRRVDSVSKAAAADDKSQGTTTTGASKERSSRACLNCRKHKMKCENADDPPCKRCRASGRTCVFQQRANAAWGPDNAIWAEIVEVRLRELETEMTTIKAMTMSGQRPAGAAWNTDRLIRTGDPTSSGHLRTNDAKQHERSPSTDSMFPDVEWPREMSADIPITSSGTMAGDSSATGDLRTGRQRMPKLYQAVTSMEGLAPSSSASGMWSDDVVEELWNFFDQHLHTMYSRVPHPLSLDALSPLLLLCLLYAASYHHPTDHMAALASTYASHLGQLVAGRTDPTRLYQNAALDGQLDVPTTYESVVGLLIVCQTLLGSSRCVPQWIAVAHRWLLDAYGKDDSVVEADWRSLWLWAYQLDVYASGLLLRPSIISPQPPSPPFPHQSPTSFPSPDEVLLNINNGGHKHFAGRGLTSVLDAVWSGPKSLPVHQSSLDKRDEQVKQDWLAELDRWRERYSEAGYELTYRLHRVLVLAIGFMTPNYQDLENLVSEAKIALQVFTSGLASPKVWEMMMITFSARMILDVISQSSSADEDLALVERTTSLLQQPAPGLRTTSYQVALATRLQELVANLRQGPTETGGSSATALPDKEAKSASINIPIPSMPMTGTGTPFEHSQRSRSMINMTTGGHFGIPTPILHATHPLPIQTLAGMTPGERFDYSTFWQETGNSGILSMNDVTPYLGTSDTAQWQTAMLTTPRSAAVDASVTSALHNSPYIPPQPTMAHQDDVMRNISRSNVFDEPPTLLQGQESWPPAFLSWLANSASQ